MTELEVLAEGLASPEGPAVLDDGRVVFVETFVGRVSAWDPRRGLHEYADVSGAPYACVLGRDGVYVAQNGATAGPWRSPNPVAPSIQRIGDDGTVEVVVDAADGEPLLGPNDLAFGPDGRLYFTDPGIFDSENPEDGRICVAEPDGVATVLVTVGPSYPNGIVAEPDGSVVWNESFTRRVRRRQPDGSIETVATLPEDRIADGMKRGHDGHLYIAGVTSGGIDVLSPDGEVVSFIETRGEPLNLTFDGTGVYVTDYGLPEATGNEVAPEAGRLLRVDVGASGATLYRGSIASPGG